MEQTQQPVRILLVDDDAGVRRSMARLLDPPHSIDCVPSVAGARAALNQTQFDLILLDINLGKDAPTGLDCLRAIEETHQRGAVCMLSGLLSPELLHEALLAGADDYLLKCDDFRLRDEVERLVDLGRLPREHRPRYASIADPGFLRTLHLSTEQIDILVEMIKRGFPPDKELAEALGLGAKALAERIKRIEARFGASSRRQLVRYLTVLAGYVRRSRLEWGTGIVDRSSLLAGATSFDPPRGWGR